MNKPISRRVVAALAAASLAGAFALQATGGDTVASFVDNTFARGTFSSSKWNVQGNASGGTTVDSNAWMDHLPSGSPAVFQPAVGTVVPGSTRSYSRFGLRMAKGSLSGATVTIPVGVEISSNQAARFRMRVVHSSSDTCNSGSFTTGTPQFVIGTSSEYGNMLSGPDTGKGTITLDAGTAVAAGPPVYLCYEFSLPLPVPTNLTNGAEATVRWTFNAEVAP